MKDSEDRREMYSTEELIKLYAQSPFTHVKTIQTSDFIDVIDRYFPPSCNQLYQNKVFHMMADFAQRIAVDPKGERDYKAIMLAIYQSLFVKISEYESELTPEVYSIAYHEFATRLVINLYTVNSVDDSGKAARSLKAVIDMLPMEVYDNEILYEKFQAIRAGHESVLNILH